MAPSAQLVLIVLGPHHTYNFENFILGSLQSAICPRRSFIDRMSPIVELLSIPTGIALEDVGVYEELAIFVS